MLKLTKYLAGYAKECILAPLFKLLEAVFQLLVPLVMASIVDTGIAHHDAHHIIVCAVLLIGMAIVGWICAIVAQYYSAKIGAGFGTSLRSDLFHHIVTLSRAELDTLGTSTLITRLTNDSNQIQDGVNQFFRLVLRCPITVFGATALAFAIDGWEGALFCGVVAIVFVLVWLIMRVAIRRYRDVQHKLDGVLLATSEELEGMRVLRAFGREKSECKAFDGRVQALRSEQVSVGDISALMNPLTYIAVNGGLVAVLAAGGVQVNIGGLTQGQLVALVNYMSQMLFELVRFANLIVSLSKASASARRVNEIFAQKTSLIDGTVSADGVAPSIEFHDVSFSYPQAVAQSLSHIQFSVQPGQSVGIIGGTGSGKSTIARLLMRFYDVSAGEILVGGQDVRTYTLESLHNLVSLVDQRAQLFAGSIASNLRLANPQATDEELNHVLTQAQADNIVQAKDGLSGAIDQLGRNLSGGQRQRLSIARTFARQPRILVLDDASSALDLATDAVLRHVLHTEYKEATKLIISQRISALRDSDLILVLDKGQLVGSGTHDELRNTCEVYREICDSQLDPEETSHE